MIKSWETEMAGDVDWSSLADRQKQELKIFFTDYFKTIPENRRKAAANSVITDVYPGAEMKQKRGPILDIVMRLFAAEKFQGMIKSWETEMAGDVDWSSLADRQKQALKIFFTDYFKTTQEDRRQAAGSVIAEVYPGAEMERRREQILDIVMRLFAAEKFQGMIKSWKTKMAGDVDLTSLTDTQKQELKIFFTDYFKTTQEDRRQAAGSVIAEVYPGAEMERRREQILEVVMNLFPSAGGGN